jgi:hypothetical protein
MITILTKLKKKFRQKGFKKIIWKFSYHIRIHHFDQNSRGNPAQGDK